MKVILILFGLVCFTAFSSLAQVAAGSVANSPAQYSSARDVSGSFENSAPAPSSPASAGRDVSVSRADVSDLRAGSGLDGGYDVRNMSGSNYYERLSQSGAYPATYGRTSAPAMVPAAVFVEPRYNSLAKQNCRYIAASGHKPVGYRHCETKNAACSRRIVSSCLNAPLFCLMAPVAASFYDNYVFEMLELDQEVSMQYSSFDGYIVYNGDTLQGIVTLTEESVILEEPVEKVPAYGYSALLSDKNLQSIVFFYDYHTLHLTRPAEDDTKLLRVVHSGKINIYDDNYSFLTYNNIRKGNLKLTYNGQYQRLKSPFHNDNLEQLINAVNTTYSTQFNSKDISWNELFANIDELN